MRIILLLFSFLISVSSYSQDIVGAWKLEKIEPVIETNKEEVTAKIIAEINQSMPQRMIYRFMHNNKIIIRGKEEPYYVKNGLLTIKSTTYNYAIEGETLLLSLDYQNMPSHAFDDLKKDFPDLKIDKYIVNIYFRKLLTNTVGN